VRGYKGALERSRQAVENTRRSCGNVGMAGHQYTGLNSRGAKSPVDVPSTLSRISVRLIRLFLCFLPSIEGACTLRGKPSSLSSPRSKAAARSCNAWPGVPPTLEPAPKCDGTTSTATANVADTSTHHATLGSLGIMPLCSLGFSPPSPLFHQIRFPSENLRVRRVPHAPSLLSRHLPCCVLLLLTDLAAPQVKT